MVLINRKTNSTDRAPIKDQLNQAETKLINLRDFQSVKKHIQSIEIMEIWIFWKIAEVLCKKHSIQKISWIKCMRMSSKVLQKYLFSTQNFKNKLFTLITLKISSNVHILYQNHRIYTLRWPNQIHTQFHVLSLAKNDLWNVCN